jgi:hypothetical protein
MVNGISIYEIPVAKIESKKTILRIKWNEFILLR